MTCTGRSDRTASRRTRIVDGCQGAVERVAVGKPSGSAHVTVPGNARSERRRATALRHVQGAEYELMTDPLSEGCSPDRRPAHCSLASVTRHRVHYMHPNVTCQHGRSCALGRPSQVIRSIRRALRAVAGGPTRPARRRQLPSRNTALRSGRARCAGIALFGALVGVGEEVIDHPMEQRGQSPQLLR
jgi:hypothetical protein